jgi:hypothetical protein
MEGRNIEIDTRWATAESGAKLGNAYTGQPPPTNRSSMLRLAYPPGGTPSISLIPPKAFVVVDSRQSGPPSHPHPGGSAFGATNEGGVPWGVDQFETCARPSAPSCGSLLRYAEQAS